MERKSLLQAFSTGIKVLLVPAIYYYGGKGFMQTFFKNSKIARTAGAANLIAALIELLVLINVSKYQSNAPFDSVMNVVLVHVSVSVYFAAMYFLLPNKAVRNKS